MRMFRIAVVGCGGVSRMHFAGYAAHPERVRVVAACDPDAERVRQAQEQWGFEEACASVGEMIEAGGWDVAAVCTPTPVREQVVKELASAGKHVFCEKPLADSFAEAERMVAACDAARGGRLQFARGGQPAKLPASVRGAAGVRLAVNQNFRYHYAFDIARRVVGEGRLGDVLTVSHHDLTFRQDRAWRTQCARHALSVMGVHWLDGFRWMLGSEARSVVCHTHSSPAIECEGETDAVAHIVFENGTAIAYVQSFSSLVGVTETVVIGERGALRLGYDSAALFAKDQQHGPVERWENPLGGKDKPGSAFNALNELLSALEEGTEPSNSGRDNLKTIALLEGAYRSAEEGRIVTFRDGLLA